MMEMDYPQNKDDNFCFGNFEIRPEFADIGWFLKGSVLARELVYRGAALWMPLKMQNSAPSFQVWTEISPRGNSFSQNPWNLKPTLVWKHQIREDFG